jgi:hypothetical protein
MMYVIIPDPKKLGAHKIHTKAYSYSIRERSGEELLRYDWHPQIEHIPYPHVHIADSQLKKLHLPTSRITIEQVLRLLITQFKVKPNRPDWRATLARGQRTFEDYCSWHFEPRRDASRT